MPLNFYNVVEPEPKIIEEDPSQQRKPSLLATLFGASAVIVGQENVNGMCHINKNNIICYFLYAY